MKNLLLILPALVLAVACNSIPADDSGEQATKTGISCEDNAWLEGMIQSLEEREDQKAQIIRYRYNNETVYLVDDCLGCADAMQIVYTCSGEEHCTFGGIAGLNTCPDFFEKATDRKVIWQN